MLFKGSSPSPQRPGEYPAQRDEGRAPPRTTITRVADLGPERGRGTNGRCRLRGPVTGGIGASKKSRDHIRQGAKHREADPDRRHSPPPFEALKLRSPDRARPWSRSHGLDEVAGGRTRFPICPEAQVEGGSFRVRHQSSSHGYPVWVGRWRLGFPVVAVSQRQCYSPLPPLRSPRTGR